MNYPGDMIRRLRQELAARYERLRAALGTDNSPFTRHYTIDGSKVRICADDFATILKELRRLK